LTWPKGIPKRFVASYGAKYPQAVDKLVKDQDALLAFYDFPAEHWLHIRTTNPIESRLPRCVTGQAGHETASRAIHSWTGIQTDGGGTYHPMILSD